MVCTLFQNSGIFEEDVTHAKTELCKKDSSKEGAGGNDEDAGDDADSDFLDTSVLFNWPGFATGTHRYHIALSRYCHAIQNKNTPPPKA